MKKSAVYHAAFAICTLLATSASCRSFALGEAATVPGHVVLARAGTESLVIWDATPEVAAIVNDKLSDEAANARLQRDTLRLIGSELTKLPSNARTLTIRIIYSKTAEVSKVYGTATFSGVERYATATVKVADAAANRAKLTDPGNALPAWVRFEVAGELPPR